MLGTRERTPSCRDPAATAGYRLRRAAGRNYALDLIALLTAVSCTFSMCMTRPCTGAASCGGTCRHSPTRDVADCIAKVGASRQASPSSKPALEFLILTAACSAEVRKGPGDEVDMDGPPGRFPPAT